MAQLLFSYGTLQQRDVQLVTFGRELRGTADQLVGFHQSMVKIADPEVIKTSGKIHHPIVKQTGVIEDRVPGTAFEVTDEELANADKYEVSDYKRVSVTLASGQTAWVYVDAHA
ncbi:MAG: gamma-glutamylcyclotransferase family protein [Gammaproteobacteria bacterium]